jgi:hypothetical protein
LVYKKEVEYRKKPLLGLGYRMGLDQTRESSCLSLKGPDLQMGFGQNKGKVRQKELGNKRKKKKKKKERCGDIWVQSKRFSEKWETRPHDSLKKETGMVFNSC